MPCYFPLQGYRSPNGGWQHKREGSIGLFDIQCGQCHGCRIDHSIMWATRATHELQTYDELGLPSSFVTLTYENVPQYGTLVPHHFQDFMKKLRHHYDHPLRYLMCGEYGDKLSRPHYHAIIFGANFDDKTILRKPYRPGQPEVFRSEKLADIWGHGFVSVGDATFASAAYVARYVLKKITGEKQKAGHYIRNDMQTGFRDVELCPPYAHMSRGTSETGSLGKRWFDKYQGDVFPLDEIYIRNNQKIQRVPVPRYYDELYRRSNPSGYKDLKRKRATALTDEQRYIRRDPERLRAKSIKKQAQIGELGRELEHIEYDFAHFHGL